MTKISFNEKGIVILDAISKEEDLTPKGRIIINAPPGDGRCNVCGRHINELKPFGGSGDPVVGDFTGELLVKTFRYDWPPDKKAEKAWQEAERVNPELPESNDPLAWLIEKYGEEKGEWIFYSGAMSPTISSSWECRDCIVLGLDEYFEKLR